jgi:EmrB/QacA subfamily drug resistance transporter
MAADASAKHAQTEDAPAAGAHEHGPDPRRWRALAVLSIAYLMVVLDVAIVNVALPSIQKDLHFHSETSLQWVVSGYALTFGGLLLLGGRAGDLLGRRRLFMIGLALFSLFSLLCGLSVSAGMLIAFRLAQGAAGAVLSPSVFSITSVTFEEGSERNKALGILGAIGGAGAAIGVLLGGVLVEYAGWEWIFFVNVPIGAATLLLVPRVVGESHAEGLTQHFDATGAATVTASLILFVYGLTETTSHGWGSGRVVASLIVSAALMVAFLAIEARSRSPLVPLGIFRRRTLLGANTIGFGLGTSIFGTFFLLSLYMHDVLGFSPIKTGVGYLAIALTAVVASGVSQALVTRAGVKPVLAAGLLTLAAGLAYLSQVSAHGSYFADLFAGFVLVGIGLGFSFVPVSIAALGGVAAHEAGLASGLINTSQQIGGALGLAILVTVSTTRTNHLLDSGSARVDALVSGFGLAFWVAVGIAAGAFAATLALLKRQDLRQLEAQPAASVT